MILSVAFVLMLNICPSAADERGDGAEAAGLGKMFSDPNLIAKLAANPRTSKHLADPNFMNMVCASHSFLAR